MTTAAAASVVTTTSAATSSRVIRVPRADDAVSPSRHVAGRPLFFLIVELLVERDALALVERFVAVLVDLGVVDKDVFRAIVRGDETEALVAEELDGSLETCVGVSRHVGAVVVAGERAGGIVVAVAVVVAG